MKKIKELYVYCHNKIMRDLVKSFPKHFLLGFIRVSSNLTKTKVQ